MTFKPFWNLFWLSLLITPNHGNLHRISYLSRQPLPPLLVIWLVIWWLSSSLAPIFLMSKSTNSNYRSCQLFLGQPDDLPLFVFSFYICFTKALSSLFIELPAHRNRRYLTCFVSSTSHFSRGSKDFS